MMNLSAEYIILDEMVNDYSVEWWQHTAVELARRYDRAFRDAQESRDLLVSDRQG